MRMRRVGMVAAALFALLLAVVAYVPIALPPVEQEPDISFRATSHDAFARRLQFGTEIVSTYGPWGLLQRGFDRRTDNVVLAVSALLALALVWGVVRVAIDAGASGLGTVVAAATAVSLIVAGGLDARFVAIALLLLLSALDPPSLSRELPLAAILGLIALIKFSLLIFTAFVVIMLVARRRNILPLVAFVAGFLIAWIGAGQRLPGLPLFFLRSAEVARGYAGASALGSGFPVIAIGAAGLALLTALVERSVMSTILVGGAAWYLAKIGYVRADSVHTSTANAMLLFLAIGYLGVRLRRLVPLTAVTMVISILIGSPIFYDRLREQWTWLHHRPALIAKFENEAAMRSDAPKLPSVNGTIDAYPWGSAAIIAKKLPYTPRPVFQSCMAWTPSLAELNASSLAVRAPEWIWAGMGSIDGRLPILDDAPSWLEIVRRYEIRSTGGEYLMLHRAASVRPLALDPLGSVTARMGEDVSLPAADRLWCAIDLRPTLTTQLRDLFGRPPVVILEMTTSDGERASWRVAVEMLRGGFLVSPQVVNVNDLAALLRDQRGRRVTGIRVIGDGYEEIFTLRFSAVKMPDRA